MIERALTVRQPWADLIMARVKDVENRTWPIPRWAYVCPDCGGSGGNARATEATLAFVPCPTCDGTDIRAEGTGECWPFRLWIHASKRAEPADADVWATWMALTGDPSETGVLLGSVTVTGCHHADDCEHHTGEGISHPYGLGVLTGAIAFCSRWSDLGTWHWTLADPVPLDEPIPLRGRQGLWTLPDDVADHLPRREVAADV